MFFSFTFPRLAPVLLAVSVLIGLQAQDLVSEPPERDSGVVRGGGLGASVFSVGTSTQIAGRPWAYVLWQPSEAGFIEGQRFAVYRKTGAPAAPGAYVLQGQVGPRMTTVAINQALSLGESLGDDLEDLEHGLGALLKDDRDDLPMAEKVLAVLRAAMQDDSVVQRLHVMSRVHPAISLILGMAHAEPLNAAGVYTYEIRLLDDKSGAESAVIGRVVVNTTLTPLPAPANVFTFFEPNERGHLNAKIRWATPPPLRARALEHYGYNVYRVAKGDAAARGWVAAAPSTAALLAAVGDNRNPRFKRVNDVPVLTQADLDTAQATNAADLKTYFFADDNGRFDPEAPGAPLNDGDEFYYYVAALDVLGRDGLISTGRLAAVYDTYAPDAPRELVASNEYQSIGATRRQFLRLSWRAPAEDSDGARLDGYLVYRWNSDREITASNRAVAAGAAMPASIGFVKHIAGTSTYQFDDTGAGAPNAATAGKTFWYTVRARDLSKRPSGGNLSGNSVPAFGVIRDRQGPEAATGLIRLSCLRPLVSPDGKTLDREITGRKEVTLECRAPADSGLAWAEFVSQGSVSLGQFALRRVGPDLVARVSLPVSRFSGDSKTQDLRVSCRVGTHSGRVSSYASQGFTLWDSDGVLLVRFKGETQRVTGVLGDEICGRRHEVHTGGSGPATRSSLCGELTAPIPVGTREYKIYRRIGDGALSLVDFGPKKTVSGPGSVTPGFSQVLDLTRNIDWCDRTVPAGADNLCYFVQTFDEHGNASPMASLGCVEAAIDLQAPTLLPLEAAGSAAAPAMSIRWFGSPHDATRFEVFISRDGNAYDAVTAAGTPLISVPTGMLSADLSPDDAGGSRIVQRILGESGGDFSVHETSMIPVLLGRGATVASDSSLFTVKVPVVLGGNYQVVVRAVGPGRQYGSRAASPLSNTQDFVWQSLPATAGPGVPWPARLGGAALDSRSFHADVIARPMNNKVAGFEGVGVRIGALDIPAESDGTPFVSQIDLLDGENLPRTKLQYPNRVSRTGVPLSMIRRSALAGFYDPLRFVFSNEVLAQTERPQLTSAPDYAGRLLPLVLYRYEVPSSLHPADRLSNDVVQVTPMMEQIAHEHHEATGNTIIHDPWVAVVSKIDAAYPRSHEIYLLDRSPVTSGASYRYVLVRFNQRTKEIERVLETPVVNIP